VVHLPVGATCQVKLQIPTQRRNVPVSPKDLVTTFRALNLRGKTSQQLARISCRQEFIRAMELEQKKTEYVHLTQCRYSSILPWNQCHGVPVPGQLDLYIQADGVRLDWRYSRKARCPCDFTNKGTLHGLLVHFHFILQEQC
jgi:hypothetical protein